MKLYSNIIKKWLQSLLTIQTDQIINSLSDAVVVIEKNDRLQYVNNHWTKLTGTLKKHSYKKPFTDFIHPEDRIAWQAAFHKFHHAKKFQLLWIRLLDKNGIVHWCEIRIQPVFENQTFPLSATLCDITPQIRSDQVKEARCRSINSLNNRIPVMLYRSRNNVNWTMEYVSDGCKKLTGYTSEKMVNNTELSYGSLIHEDDQEAVWCNVQTAIESDQCFEISYRLLHVSGEIRKVHEKGCAIYSDTGDILGIEGVIFTLQQPS